MNGGKRTGRHQRTCHRDECGKPEQAVARGGDSSLLSPHIRTRLPLVASIFSLYLVSAAAGVLLSAIFSPAKIEDNWNVKCVASSRAKLRGVCVQVLTRAQFVVPSVIITYLGDVIVIINSTEGTRTESAH